MSYIDFEKIKENIIPMFGEITEEHLDECMKGAIEADRESRNKQLSKQRPNPQRSE